jgi:hypothetical protein
MLEAIVQYGDDCISDEFSLEDVKLAEGKLNDVLNVINENFIPKLFELNDKDNTILYTFILKAAEKIQNFSKDNKTTFLSLVRKLNRYFTVCFNKLDKKTKEIISIINIVKQIAVQKDIQGDEKLILAKQQLIEIINKHFEDPTTNIEVLCKTFQKDITKVTDILKETGEIAKISSVHAVEFLKN